MKPRAGVSAVVSQPLATSSVAISVAVIVDWVLRRRASSAMSALAPSST